MRAIWICLVSICVVASSPLKDANIDNLEHLREALRNDNPSVIESIILNLIEDLRNIIYNGSDDMMIPVLDPLYINELTLDDEIIPLPGARIHIADTTVKNIGTFDVDELSVTTLLIVNRVHFSGYIPLIEIDVGQYDLSVSAAGFNVFGAGRSSFRIFNPRVTADLSLRIGLTGLTLTDRDVKFTMGDFEPEITGMFGHEGASDFVNLFLKNLVPEVLEFYETEINELLSDIVRAIVTEVLP